MVVNRHFECSTPVLAHDRSCYWALHLPSKQAILSGGQDGQLKVHRNDAQVVALDVHQSAIYRGVLQGNVLWTCGRDRDVKAGTSLPSTPPTGLPHARSVNAMVVGGPNDASWRRVATIARSRFGPFGPHQRMGLSTAALHWRAEWFAAPKPR